MLDSGPGKDLQIANLNVNIQRLKRWFELLRVTISRSGTKLRRSGKAIQKFEPSSNDVNRKEKSDVWIQVYGQSCSGLVHQISQSR